MRVQHRSAAALRRDWASGDIIRHGHLPYCSAKGGSVPVKLPLPGGPSIRRVGITTSTSLRPLPHPLFHLRPRRSSRLRQGKMLRPCPFTRICIPHEFANYYCLSLTKSPFFSFLPRPLVFGHNLFYLLVGVCNFTWTLRPRVEDGCIFRPSPTMVSFKPRPPLS